MSQLLIFGDSITAGAWDSAGGWAARLISYLNTRNIHEDQFYCMSYNLGVSGDCAEDIAARMPGEIAARYDAEESLSIVLAVGVNDSQFFLDKNEARCTVESFRSSLATIAGAISGYAARALVLGPAPVDDSRLNPTPWAPERSYQNEYITLFNEELKGWAQENVYSFIDVFRLWIGENYVSLLSDGLHPNSEGHKRIFELVLAEVNGGRYV